jgi:hypothetical protein
MVKEWNELSRMTQGKPVTVERVRLNDNDIVIEGSFSLPPLANLSPDDQVFIMAFVKCGGSIKEMEQMFGISYPTVKNRLNRVAEQLDFVKITRTSPQEEVIEELERGDISAEEAIRRLSK